MGMGLNHTVYTLMKVSLRFKAIFSLEVNNQKITFPTFGNEFLTPLKKLY